MLMTGGFTDLIDSDEPNCFGASAKVEVLSFNLGKYALLEISN